MSLPTVNNTSTTAAVEVSTPKLDINSLVAKSIELAKQQQWKKQHPFNVFGAGDLFKTISESVDLPQEMQNQTNEETKE